VLVSSPSAISAAVDHSRIWRYGALPPWWTARCGRIPSGSRPAACPASHRRHRRAAAVARQQTFQRSPQPGVHTRSRDNPTASSRTNAIRSACESSSRSDTRPRHQNPAATAWHPPVQALPPQTAQHGPKRLRGQVTGDSARVLIGVLSSKRNPFATTPAAPTLMVDPKHTDHESAATPDWLQFQEPSI
jgi:hypothetical protein